MPKSLYALCLLFLPACQSTIESPKANATVTGMNMVEPAIDTGVMILSSPPEDAQIIPDTVRVEGYFNTDTAFPKIPAGIKFTPGVQNTGPDANEYRGHSGKILDGDQTGIAVSTFTAHCSPLGLCFDTKRILAKEFNGDGFVIRYSSGAKSFMMEPFTREGTDLLHLHLTYDSTLDNYFVRSVRIVDGFNEPTDAVLVKNHMYVIEYGGKGGNIWKITLPMDEKRIQKNKPGKKTKTR